MDYWAESNNLDLCESEITRNGSVLTKCRSEVSSNQVWNLFIANGRHSWPSITLNGIDANSLILEFFDSVSP